MLRLALFFFLLAIIAGVLGFTGIAGPFMTIAKVLFFAFLIVWGVLLLLGLTIYKSLT